MSAGKQYAPGFSASCSCDAAGRRTRGVCSACYMAQFRQENPDYYARQLAVNRANYRTVLVKNKDKKYLINVRAKYGLSASEHRELFEFQQGQCAICFVHQDQIPTRLHVDHCHGTGSVRGLLCRNCNLALGGQEKAGTNVYRWYLEWTPMMRLEKMKTLTPEEQALWNWS
jgi:hypothetical protein